MSQSQLGNASTISERWFEEYLTSQGYQDWSHEQPTEGRPTTPDYRLRLAGAYVFFDVKEFDAPLPSLKFGAFDPYGPLREKINQAARQFKHYKEFSCSVVLANPKCAFVHLFSPEIVLGTMLGNLGFTVRLGAPPGP